MDGNSAAALAPFRAAAEAELPAIKPAGGGATASASATSDSGDKVDLDLPGIHIHTNGDGRAEVNAMGVHVDADDKDSHHAVITTPGGPGHDQVTVNADDGGARIEVHEKGSGIRSMFMLASDKPGPNGWKSVGFEARGPAGRPARRRFGPLEGRPQPGPATSQARALVKHNVGRLSGARRPTPPSVRYLVGQRPAVLVGDGDVFAHRETWSPRR